MASKIRSIGDRDLINIKPVFWSIEADGVMYGVCGHTNKVFKVSTHPLAPHIISDIYIGLDGCVEEGCEEAHNCLNYECSYCKASNMKEGWLNSVVYKGFPSNTGKKNVEGITSTNWTDLEDTLRKLEDTLRKHDYLPVKEYCVVKWE